ncbi:Uncharacterised protein [Halioglobus japonicus]|nr:Uncharacterised protein [Halioglobus japonicus]
MVSYSKNIFRGIPKWENQYPIYTKTVRLFLYVVICRIRLATGLDARFWLRVRGEDLIGYV